MGTFLITMLISFVSTERLKKMFCQVIRESLGNQDDVESQAKAQKYCFHLVLNCPVILIGWRARKNSTKGRVVRPLLKNANEQGPMTKPGDC